VGATAGGAAGDAVEGADGVANGGAKSKGGGADPEGVDPAAPAGSGGASTGAGADWAKAEWGSASKSETTATDFASGCVTVAAFFRCGTLTTSLWRFCDEKRKTYARPTLGGG
jgi:hypothetical protein